MALKEVKQYLEKVGCTKEIEVFDCSSATVPLAAQALHTECCNIAKTMSFLKDDQCFVIVLAGDVKIDNHKYKETFSCKARMVSGEEVLSRTGHPVGGVCPFALKEDVLVYLDESLKRMDIVYPACGTANSAIGLTILELEKFSQSKGWVDVSKLIEDTVIEG